MDSSDIIPEIHDTYKMFLEPIGSLDPNILGTQKKIKLFELSDEDLAFIDSVDESKIPEPSHEKRHVILESSENIVFTYENVDEFNVIFTYDEKTQKYNYFFDRKKFINLVILEKFMKMPNFHSDLTGLKRTKSFSYIPGAKRKRSEFDDVVM